MGGQGDRARGSHPTWWRTSLLKQPETVFWKVKVQAHAKGSRQNELGGMVTDNSVLTMVNGTSHRATEAGVQRGVVGLVEQGKCIDTDCEGGTNHCPAGTQPRSQIRCLSTVRNPEFYTDSSPGQTLPIDLL